MAEYIDRDEYIKSLKDSFAELSKIYKTLDNKQDREICEAQLITFTECILRIKDMPAADVAPLVHGKWIEECETISASRGRRIKNVKIIRVLYK